MLRKVLRLTLRRGAPGRDPDELLTALRQGPKTGGARFWDAISAILLVLAATWLVVSTGVLLLVLPSSAGAPYVTAVCVFLGLIWAWVLTFEYSRFLDTGERRHWAYALGMTLAAFAAAVWLLA
jgi:hypothetical protein